MFQAHVDYLIVKITALFNTSTGFRGIDDKEIVLNHIYFVQMKQIVGEEWLAKHTRIYGEVVSVPKYLSRIKLHQDPQGLPAYHSPYGYNWRWLSDIAMEVNVNDRVYFHYLAVTEALSNDSFIHVEGNGENRVWYVRVRYDQIFCAVRKEKIIPIQGYAFIRPNLESWEDILKPVAYVGEDGKPMKNKDGSPMLKPKSEWIRMKIVPDHKYLEGFVEHIGTPLYGDKRECDVGQKILYKRNADWKQRIEGKDYFTILQRHIIGRFVEEAA